MVENTTHAESTDFQPSKLGKKAHWDQVYEQEIVNFNDHGDIGEKNVCIG